MDNQEQKPQGQDNSQFTPESNQGNPPLSESNSGNGSSLPDGKPTTDSREVSATPPSETISSPVNQPQSDPSPAPAPVIDAQPQDASIPVAALQSESSPVEPVTQPEQPDKPFSNSGQELKQPELVGENNADQIGNYAQNGQLFATEDKNGENKVNFDDYSSPMSDKELNNSSENEEKNSKIGTIITVILIAVVAFGIWNANKDNGQEIAGDTEEDIKITVDDRQEEGEVRIVEQNDNSVITQKIGENKLKITAYYQKTGADCGDVSPLERVVEKKYDSEVVNVVRGLLISLSSEEAAAGWSTAIPAGTYLRNIRISDGIASITLSQPLSNITESCSATAAKTQIERTLLQFPYIMSVQIQD